MAGFNNASSLPFRSIPSPRVSALEIFLPGFANVSPAIQQLLADHLNSYTGLLCTCGILLFLGRHAYEHLFELVDKFLISTVYLFTIGDPIAVSQTPYVYPIIQMLYNATGSKGATTAMMTLVLFIGVVAVFSTLASVSRLTWAFAKDKGLPFSGFFSHVHPKLRIPLNSLLLISIIVILLNLINIGSTTAFFAILSLNTLALYISYIIPIILFIIHKMRGFPVPYGPFKLPRGLGLPINFFAVCYAIFISIWLPFPAVVPVNAQTMNYGGPVIGFVILLALGDWCIDGRKRFVVPVDIRNAGDEGARSDSP